MRLRYTLFLLVYCLSLSQAQDRDAIVKHLADEGIFELQTVSFRDVDGSEVYIKKFRLGNSEIDLIGSWFVDTYTTGVGDELFGPGIDISFFPNRMFSVFRGEDGPERIENVVGKWKVEGSKLMVRFIAKAVRISGEDFSNSITKWEYLDTRVYYPIFDLQMYRTAVVNDKPFYWDRVPARVRSFYGIIIDDRPRFRLLFDTLGKPPGVIQPGTEDGDLLLNPATDEEYLRKLVRVW